MVYLDGIAVQIRQKLGGIKNLLRVIFLPVQLDIADTVNRQGMPDVSDNLRGLLQERFGVIQKLAAAPAVNQNIADCGRLQKRFIPNRCQDVRQHMVSP